MPLDTLRGAVVAGIGMCVPERILTNAELESMVDTTDEWIFSRTGIRERRIAAPDQATSDFAVGAAREALASAGMDASELDLIVVATCTGDTNSIPATAAYVQDRLGLRGVPAFDIAAACSGFVYGLDVAHQFIASGRYDNVLVVGAETMSRIVDWSDRTTCVLFGDGGGAAVLRPCPVGEGILATEIGADGAGACLLYVPGGGTRLPLTAEAIAAGSQRLVMEGKKVYAFAVEIMGTASLKALARAGLTPADVDLFVPHQANIRIIRAAADRMGLPMDRVLVNVDRYGNTSAASIPIALTEAWREGRIREGSVVVTVGFGAGLTWGANVLRWGKVGSA